MSLTNNPDNLKRKRNEAYPELTLHNQKMRSSNTFGTGRFNNNLSMRNKRESNLPLHHTHTASNTINTSLGKINHLNTEKNKSVSLQKFKNHNTLQNVKNVTNINSSKSNISNISNISNNPFIPKRPNSIEKTKNIIPKLNSTKHPSNLNSNLNNSIQNLHSVSSKDILLQFGGNLNEMRKLKKKNKESLIDKEMNKKRIEQLTDFIQSTNNYINNVCKNYTEKYRKSTDIVGNNLVRDLNFSENMIDKEIQRNAKTENKIYTKEDEDLEKRYSMPEFNYFSTGNTNTISNVNESSYIYSESINNESIKEDGIEKIEENLISLQQNKINKVTNFSFKNEEKEEYYIDKITNNYNNFDNFTETSLESAEQLEILNNRIKEKERDFNLVIENFDLILSNKTKTNPQENKELVIKEYMEREIQLKQRLENMNRILNNKSNENESLNNSIIELMNELNRGETHRRKLHNYIQELRGNIRVYCRVKPTNNMIVESNVNTCVRYPEMTSYSNNKSELYTIEIINNNTNNSLFHFDKVFTETSHQREIFQEIRPFLQTALDGENISIFAYGATGSGKTYTMQGPSWASDDKVSEFSGILPRSAEYIFDEISRLNKLNQKINIFISAIEIYNENIFDLFDSNCNKQPLQLFTNKNTIQLKNLIFNQIKNKEDIIRFTKEASDSRRSDSTQFNENSSRSHALFQLKIESTQNNINKESLINIIDLAGSEKCSLNYTNKSKDEIENMKKLQNEANFINKSLSTLGRIIAMLADKKSNKLAIPYRESKLTMILQVI